MCFKPRKKRFHGRKTVNLSIPQSEASSTKLSHIDEYISSSPTYQTVPDFQRVQITGDYASGVSCFFPSNVAAGKTQLDCFSFLTFLPFLLRKVLVHLSFAVLHYCISILICHDLYFCFVLSSHMIYASLFHLLAHGQYVVECSVCVTEYTRQILAQETREHLVG